MANCKYCDKPAGFLRKKHAECVAQHQEHQRLIQNGCSQITALSLSAIKGVESFNSLKNKISEIEQSHSIPEQNRKSLLIKSWENAVEDFLEDGVLDRDEENRLAEFKEYFSLSQDDLNKNGVLTKTAKAAIIRDILNGIVPQRLSVEGNLPINFQKDEKIVWAFQNSQYLEDKHVDSMLEAHRALVFV